MSEPIVLLPGMMCDARLFEPQIMALSREYSVMVMPLIGQNSIRGLAHNVLQHAPPRFSLLGLSMGGIVAMEVIRQASERVARLALLDTNPMADPPDRAELRDQQKQRVANGGLRSVIRDEMKPNYLADGQRKIAILDLCMSMAESLGPKVFVDQSDALKSRADQCETLKQVKVPTLIACGESDGLCPLEKHELMHKLISGSHLSIIPQAGHLPTLEQPELSNKEILRWLKR